MRAEVEAANKRPTGKEIRDASAARDAEHA